MVETKHDSIFWLWFRRFFTSSRQVLARRRSQVDAATKPQLKIQAHDHDRGNPKSSSAAAAARVFNVFGEQICLGTKKPFHRAASEGALKKVPDSARPDVQRQARVQFQVASSGFGKPLQMSQPPKFAQDLPPVFAAAAPSAFAFAAVGNRPSIKPASHATENRGFEAATAARYVPVAEAVEPDVEDSNQVFHSADASKFEFSKPKAPPPLPPPKPVKRVQKVRWVK